MKSLRLSPSVSITLGLVSITMLMFFMLDSVVGIFPNEQKELQVHREKVSTNLSVQLSIIANEKELLDRTIENIQKFDKEILSLAVRLANGRLLSSTGNHRAHWVPQEASKSTINHVQVPIKKGPTTWGSVEISFLKHEVETPLEFISKPVVALPLTIIFGGFILYYLYLRRVLNHLDPTRVIPSRVNAALDTLTEGVMILDNHENVMLVNEAFNNLHPLAKDIKLGAKAGSQEWLVDSFRLINKVLPWQPVLTEARPVHMPNIKLEGMNEDNRFVTVSAAPILDTEKKVRGCLITFSDVTEQVLLNDRMRRTLMALHSSQEKIEAQNKELQHLASYDQLSGMLNRRAFFEMGEKQFRMCQTTNLPLICVMCDIDHFKRINDGYSHAVGDAAIRSVSGIIRHNIRDNDILGRYGGEEFCIVFPGLTLELGLERAEQIRRFIEEKAGPGVRSVEGLKITSSFGVSILSPTSESLEALIDEADQALYYSKENGRNLVALYGRDVKKPATALSD